MVYVVYAAVSLFAYLLGSLNTAILLSGVYKKDIRDYGSKNAGTTNVLRTFGKAAALIVLICDLLKAVLAVFLVKIAVYALVPVLPGLQVQICVYLAGLFVVLGHNYPLYFKFRGGKGIATSLAACLMIDPLLGLIAALLGIAVIALTRYVSLGSVLGVITYFILALVLRHQDIYFVIFAFLIACLAVWRHRSNMARLFHGTESKLGAKKEEQSKQDS